VINHFSFALMQYQIVSEYVCIISSSLHSFVHMLAWLFESTCLELVIRRKLKEIFFFCFSFIQNRTKWTMSCSIWFISRDWDSNVICILDYSFSNRIERHLCFRSYLTLDFEDTCEWTEIQWNTSFSWLTRTRCFKINSFACKFLSKIRSISSLSTWSWRKCQWIFTHRNYVRSFKRTHIWLHQTNCTSSLSLEREIYRLTWWTNENQRKFAKSEETEEVYKSCRQDERDEHRSKHQIRW
jgi:hypothetical protein